MFQKLYIRKKNISTQKSKTIKYGRKGSITSSSLLIVSRSTMKESKISLIENYNKGVNISLMENYRKAFARDVNK